MTNEKRRDECGFLGCVTGGRAGREGKAGRVVVGFANTLRWFLVLTSFVMKLDDSKQGKVDSSHETNANA